ncbi:MAG: hypothetical protein CL878_10925 [Dehalococcoidia bacterium]|nr:hypothetical protein [Dehalococcoidia bacterium]
MGFDAWRAQDIEMSGTTGMLYMNQVWNNEHQTVTLEHHTSDGVETTDFEAVHQLKNQLEHLCQCLATGQPHRIPPENSIKQMQVIDAVFESIATRRAVEM